MGSYESTVAFHPDLGEAGVKDQVERIKQVLSASGGSVRQAVEWGLRDLAYPIRRQRRAHFYVFVFDGDGKVVSELERNLRISDHVLRYISVTVDPDRAPLELGRPRREPGEGEGGENAIDGEESRESDVDGDEDADTVRSGAE